MSPLAVIASWKNAATRRFAEHDKGRFPGLDEEKAKARLQLLDAARSMDEIPSLASAGESPPPILNRREDSLAASGLHKLKGDRKRQWAMTIVVRSARASPRNGPWRLAFEFRDGDAYNVEIVDYH